VPSEAHSPGLNYLMIFLINAERRESGRNS
jgi:hypothetical protein